MMVDPDRPGPIKMTGDARRLSLCCIEISAFSTVVATCLTSNAPELPAPLYDRPNKVYRLLEIGMRTKAFIGMTFAIVKDGK
jgi:hypothetical protein